ncbi:MAG: response regulator [Pirellula sp.]|jgi:chemotaxis family two-component system response regulator Rcp1
MNQRKPHRCIILIEDNFGDVVLFRESLSEADNNVSLTVFRNYDEVEFAISELEAGYKDSRMIILLDLNLPRCSGFDLIPLFRDNPVLQYIPIVIFTSSQAPKDIMRAFQAGVNAYVPKPDDLAGYRSVAKSLVNFWLHNSITTSAIDFSTFS